MPRQPRTMLPEMLRRTPLYSSHQRLGGKLIEFGGWEMPVQYTTITDEHLAVRKAAGIFDISHMGEIFVEGPRAAAFLNRTLTNDIGKLSPGKGQYSLMCNPEGGTIDDLYVYFLGDDRFLLIVNASRIEADLTWLRAALDHFGPAGVELRNESDHWGAVAVQGPSIVKFAPPEILALRKNEVTEFSFLGARCIAARTGYTGEDGFELVAPSAAIVRIWEELLKAGSDHGLKPAGLGARDTLRTEMCYPLYGHELNETTSPIEAGVGFFVALDKGDFTGRSVLAAQKQSGTTKKLAAFVMTSRSAPPRPDYPIHAPGGDRIGTVVSGTQSPSLNLGIGLGYLPPASTKPGTELEIEIRGRRSPARVVPKPIYRKTD
jgi:aminomethyltransferase